MFYQLDNYIKKTPLPVITDKGVFIALIYFSFCYLIFLITHSIFLLSLFVH